MAAKKRPMTTWEVWLDRWNGDSERPLETDPTIAVAMIVCLTRDFVDNVKRILAKVDPRMMAEVRSRSQDALITAMQTIDGIMPPLPGDAKKRRDALRVVPGGSAER